MRHYAALSFEPFNPNPYQATEVYMLHTRPQLQCGFIISPWCLSHKKVLFLCKDLKRHQLFLLFAVTGTSIQRSIETTAGWRLALVRPRYLEKDYWVRRKSDRFEVRSVHPVAERVAEFYNNGTLWWESTLPIQLESDFFGGRNGSALIFGRKSANRFLVAA